MIVVVRLRRSVVVKRTNWTIDSVQNARCTLSALAVRMTELSCPTSRTAVHATTVYLMAEAGGDLPLTAADCVLAFEGLSYARCSNESDEVRARRTLCGQMAQIAGAMSGKADGDVHRFIAVLDRLTSLWTTSTDDRRAALTHMPTRVSRAWLCPCSTASDHLPSLLTLSERFFV
jgi:hypothetical protein